MKKTVEVRILGQKFMIRSESDESYVTEIADFINSKVTEITEKSKSTPALNVAILAAMNIADEYMKLKGEKDSLFVGMEKKIQSMIELIDLQT